MIGETIGHYRVTGKLGEGGMGVVYRATDVKLGRDVAVKLLPALVANDAGRLARFEREARLLASLNHPNIATVYEVAGGALVMELVEGETLAERLARGAMPVTEALPLAAQVAEALEAAHEKGIIHRDLKPANIRVTPEGRVKVLDFGLAKALESEGREAAENSPTLTEATRYGAILGTAAYMSPEQARGKPVDRRADIWAFGLVLYEMLAGRQMFGGETASDSLAGVLKGPIELEGLPADTPSAVRRLLRRCLERDPRERLRDIGDARLELKEAGIGEEQRPAEAAPVRSRTGWIPWTVAAACLAAVAVLGWAWFGGRTEVKSTVRFAIPPPDGHFFSNLPAVSPDGKWIAWLAATDTLSVGGSLWIRPIPAIRFAWLIRWPCRGGVSRRLFRRGRHPGVRATSGRLRGLLA